MTIIPSVVHPAWCDPRVHADLGDTADHRSVPTTLVPIADAVVLHVGLSQLHEAGHSPAPVHVAVTVVHLDDATTTAFDLSSADARLIAAALSVEADRATAAAATRAVTR